MSSWYARANVPKYPCIVEGCARRAYFSGDKCHYHRMKGPGGAILPKSAERDNLSEELARDNRAEIRRTWSQR